MSGNELVKVFHYSIFKQVRVVSGVIPLYLRVKVIFPMQLLSNIDIRDIPFLLKWEVMQKQNGEHNSF